MDAQNILIVGGGIGGLTAAIALGRDGHQLTIVEKDPAWAVYGVGIIQQANVVRAMTELGVINDYVAAGFGFDEVEVYVPTGARVAKIPSHKLVEGLPAQIGIGRRALHKVLGDRAKAAGADVRLGVTVSALDDDGTQVTVQFSDGTNDSYDLVVGADGLYSTTRSQIMADAPQPEFTGQAVWRYNFDRPDDVTCLQAYEGMISTGLVPLSDSLMYMYVTTPEPDNPFYPVEGIAAAMRGKIANCAPRIAELGKAIVDDAGVVYRPLEWLFLESDWHKGRVVLLGDAAHATTPHLGQGAGMAIEDAIVLAEELRRHASPQAAFSAFRDRRFARCKYIVEQSLALCHGQIGRGPPVDQAAATRAMFDVVAQPI